ncbi:taurine transport system substrate-binding protein [Rhizobiales bacterium GAS188]|nr:taurine transport system substrate-binding protein [Rhizobiales bacterium GAS188]
MRKTRQSRLAWLSGLASLALAWSAAGAMAQTKEVTFAHQDMINPFRVVIAQGEIEKATGYKINWRKFDGGGDVIRAMASGDVQIGEVGSSPAAAAASQGMDVQVIWILEDIGDGEQLVARNGSGVSKVADLKGKKVATPFVSTSHYQLLAALADAGLTQKDVQVLNMRPPEIAAAWERGDIDATFVWDPALARVKQNGKVLLSSGDIAKTGKPTFDAIMVQRSWAEKNKDFVATVLKLIAKKDAEYAANKAKWTADSQEAKQVGKVAGADPKEVPAAMAEYSFPDLKQQASPAWLGGGKDALAVKALTDTSKFLKEQGRITEVLPDYTKYVTSDYVEAAMK